MNEQRRQQLLNSSPLDTFSYENNVRMIRVEEGVVEAEAVLTDHQRNLWHTPHGGIIFTLLDVACGCAALTTSEAQTTVTVSSTIQYISSSPSIEKLVATGVVDRSGRSLAFCSARICDEKGNLVAQGESVMKYISGEKW